MSQSLPVPSSFLRETVCATHRDTAEPIRSEPENYQSASYIIEPVYILVGHARAPFRLALQSGSRDLEQARVGTCAHRPRDRFHLRIEAVFVAS